jgi:rhamnosyl/mannosyltransferase
MKVLQISKFYPPDRGGIEAVARDLSAGFVRRGLTVEVLCANRRMQHSDETDALGVRVTRAASFGMWLSTSMAPGMARDLWRRRADPDIVHVHMPDPLAALAVWLVRPRARLVVHWHSDVVRQRVARHVYRPLERWLLGRADAVIATSQAYAESSPALREVAGKVVVIPIGAPPPETPDPQRVERLRRRYGHRHVVFALGRMTYYKGWDVLIEAARSLPEDVVVVVGGGGEDLETYRAMAERAGVSERIRFVGGLSPANVEAHFAVADLFCVASTVRAEAYGVAAVEAMARGCPVVATDIPGSGLGWLHQHEVTGLKVPVRDPLALAEAISTLVADAGLRSRYGAAGRARWAAHFTADKMAEETLTLYCRLLGQPVPMAHPNPRTP